MKNISIWKYNCCEINNYNRLDKDIFCDVLIIGGGITGVSTLYYLDNKGLDVVLVEQNKLGFGITSNSTGKLTFLQDNIYNSIINKYGEDKALQYLNSQKFAINMIIDTINKEKIECDLEKCDSYVYTNNDKDIDDLVKLRDFLKRNSIDVFEKNIPLVISKYMFGVKDTYLINPLKFVRNLSSIISSSKIYEDTCIIKCKKSSTGYICYTKNNTIKCKYVVVASHYPFFNIPYLFPLKGTLEKSYIGSGKKKIDNVSLISYSDPYISIRNYKDYLIYLTNSHINSKDINDKKHFFELKKKFNDLNVSLDYMWSNIDIITNDKLPYIGKINDNLFIGTGYNTWGLTNGFLAGYMISKLIMNSTVEYKDLFDPLRKIKGNVLEIAKDSYYNLFGMLNGIFYSNNIIKKEFINGRDVFVYNSNNIEYKVYSKCPHMKCRLIFNEIEKTWDCPCHGSRFDIKGKCISGPSNNDIMVKNKEEK